jgi:hypothetical protein
MKENQSNLEHNIKYSLEAGTRSLTDKALEELTDFGKIKYYGCRI